VPQRDDIHYPSEESTERANNPPPRITGITISSDSTCSVKVSDQVIAVPGVVSTTNSTYGWFAYACIADSGDGRGSMAVLGQTFSRWSRLLYVHAHPRHHAHARPLPPTAAAVALTTPSRFCTATQSRTLECTQDHAALTRLSHPNCFLLCSTHPVRAMVRYLNASGPVVDLRLSVGAAQNLSQPRYNFTK
jgi:hypothetical protein